MKQTLAERRQIERLSEIVRAASTLRAYAMGIRDDARRRAPLAEHAGRTPAQVKLDGAVLYGQINVIASRVDRYVEPPVEAPTPKPTPV